MGGAPSGASAHGGVAPSGVLMVGGAPSGLSAHGGSA